ncbi:MAG: hypothetical protein U1E15_14175 [Hyphomicrobiales bacterium]
MRSLKSLFAAGVALLAAAAVKKLVGSIEKQAEAARVKREEQRDVKDFKRLKQDPATGVYYAED